MPLTPGSRLGPYEIGVPLGQGGMGEVYRARDTKLQRDVALKVLPDSWAADADRRARFQREAQVLASLNHTNIGAIYGFEDGGGVGALVLELVDGPTLADRIAAGPIPLDEALSIARQIADALEGAHEHGIIHRDLKPSNVKVRPDGTVKVLDFGLAKMLDGQPAAPGVSQSPTMAVSMPGVLLGTAAYMSPEQAKGRDADRASDVWAFGCVLYEMLTGRQAFAGETASEIISEVLKSEPDWSRLPAATPEAIRRLLHRCLQKDRKRRLRDIADARLELDATDTAAASPGARERGVSRHRERLAWAMALAVTACVLVIAITWGRNPAAALAPAAEVRLEINAPPTTDPASMAISPDGAKLVFVSASEGRIRLWLRSLDSVSARPLPGTDGGLYPFWSPDSRSIGFFSEDRLKRIDIDGESVTTLATAPVGSGGSWSREGVIIFAPIPDSSLLRVPAAGGKREPLTRLERAQGGHRFPQFLPDGRHFLYYVTGAPDVRGVYVGQLDGPETRRLFDADTAAVYSASGHLLFVRQGTLFAQGFDPARLSTTANPFPVAERVVVDSWNVAALSASGTGSIVFRTGGSGRRRQFIWYDRSGREVGRVGEPDSAFPLNPSVSPDGRRVALTRVVNGNSDVWMMEIGRPVLTRFTFEPEPDICPVWSPDGARILYSSAQGRPFALYQRAANGAGTMESLADSPSARAIGIAMDWSPDGRFALYRSSESGINWDIWALPLTGNRTPFPVVQSSFVEREGQFSPDGKWMAFQSNESGRFEVYVQPFPGPGAKSQISSGGGSQPRWRRDGKELFYVSAESRLVAVPVQLPPSGETVSVGAPTPLFVALVGSTVSGGSAQQYIVSPDGQRFLMNTMIEEASPITVVLNWKARAGSGN